MVKKGRHKVAHPTVVQSKGNPPYIYLYVTAKQKWYCYNPLESPLGSGAMGDVYMGYKCDEEGRVAIKRVKDAYANDPRIRERAKLEASLEFRHDNLVEMIGYCEWAPDHGPIFLISNFVDGVNINDYFKELNNTQNRVEMISKAICSVLDALDYIHSKGVIHRDIKPSNIMVEKNSNVRLMDLGIARMNGGNKFSHYGFIGTPQYAAPEQILRKEGNNTTINATTDIYALGITFYELLTGNNPMDCPADSDTITKQLKEPLPIDDDIPTRLMKVISKATEKDQAKRYQTALEFKQAIEQAFEPEPTIWQKILTYFNLD